MDLSGIKVPKTVFRTNPFLKEQGSRLSLKSLKSPATGPLSKTEKPQVTPGPSQPASGSVPVPVPVSTVKTPEKSVREGVPGASGGGGDSDGNGDDGDDDDDYENLEDIEKEAVDRVVRALEEREAAKVGEEENVGAGVGEEEGSEAVSVPGSNRGVEIGWDEGVAQEFAEYTVGG